jgi:hypothetical protein
VVVYEIPAVGLAEVHVLHQGYVGRTAEDLSTAIILGHSAPFHPDVASGRDARG